MTHPDKKGGLQDVHEAQNPSTSCERQVELASSPLVLVRRALAKNPELCDPAKEILGSELDKLRQVAGDGARNALG